MINETKQGCVITADLYEGGGTFPSQEWVQSTQYGKNVELAQLSLLQDITSTLHEILTILKRDN